MPFLLALHEYGERENINMIKKKKLLVVRENSHKIMLSFLLNLDMMVNSLEVILTYPNLTIE